MSTTTGADSLFTSAGETAQLLGGRCVECDTHVFPLQGACPRCGGELAQVGLPRSGTLWSTTVQRLAPKPPYLAPASTFVPFAIGYVDLGRVLVEAPLWGKPPERWSIGEPVQLVVPAERLAEQPGWRFWFEAGSA
jgi:uncharacterized OB-fold protein